MYLKYFINLSNPTLDMVEIAQIGVELTYFDRIRQPNGERNTSEFQGNAYRVFWAWGNLGTLKARKYANWTCDF